MDLLIATWLTDLALIGIFTVWVRRTHSLPLRVEVLEIRIACLEHQLKEART